MQFLTALVLASSASASLVRRQGTSGSTAAVAGNDVAVLFTGFSDAQCATVNTEEEVTFEAYDGYCRAIDPALSLTAVDMDVDGTVLYNFWAYTSDDCDPANAVLIGDDECHAAPVGKPFLSFMMVTDEEEGSESGSDSDILVARE